MTKPKKVWAIVRGPEPYFDGTLHPSGSAVLVDPEFVSDKDYVEEEVTVRLAQPIMHEGKLVREAQETRKKKVKFRPIKGVAPEVPDADAQAKADAEAEAARQAAADAAAGGQQGDKFDVTAFLGGDWRVINAEIEEGKHDEFLDVIEQGEIAGKGRASITSAIGERRTALAG